MHFSDAFPEIHTYESYFKFRTRDADNDNSSSLDIRTSRYFLGQEGNSFVSGALGSIQISSSNFHLSPEGNITASNFELQSGVVRADVTIEGDLSANSIAVPSGGPYKAQIKSDGHAEFTSGSVAGWDMTTEYISKPLTGHTNTATSRIYLSVTSSNAQNIQQGLHIYRDNDDTDAGEVKVIRVGQLSDTSDLHATGSNDYGFQIIKNRTATA